MKLKLNTLFLCLLACLGLLSCSPKSEQDKNSKGFEDAEKDVKDVVKGFQRGGVPKASEIPYMLQATGADFNPSLVNDRRNAVSYGSQSEKASLNLGVFTADIGYLSSYEKTQESIDYLNTCKKLADDLGVSGTFDRATLEKFEANIANKDSLAALLDDAMQKADQYLTGSNNKLGALLVTGSYVESLYIATGIIKSYPKDILPADSRNQILTQLIQLVARQKEPVSEVAKMLSAVEQTGAIPAIVADFRSLEASYKALNIEEKIKNNTGSLVLTDQTLKDIISMVEKLRGDIVIVQ